MVNFRPGKHIYTHLLVVRSLFWLAPDMHQANHMVRMIHSPGGPGFRPFLARQIFIKSHKVRFSYLLHSVDVKLYRKPSYLRPNCWDSAKTFFLRRLYFPMFRSFSSSSLKSFLPPAVSVVILSMTPHCCSRRATSNASRDRSLLVA